MVKLLVTDWNNRARVVQISTDRAGGSSCVDSGVHTGVDSGSTGLVACVRAREIESGRRVDE